LWTLDWGRRRKRVSACIAKGKAVRDEMGCEEISFLHPFIFISAVLYCKMKQNSAIATLDMKGIG